MGKDSVRDESQNSWMMDGSENKNNQNSTDNENTPKQISVELGSETLNKCCVGSEENADKGAHKEVPTPSEPESEKTSGVFSKTSPGVGKNAAGETCQRIKEEKKDEIIEEINKERMEELVEIKNEIKEEENVVELTITKPILEKESCQNTDNGDGAETGKQNGKDVLTQLKSCTYKEKKRKGNSMSENLQEDTCSNGDVGRERANKRQRLDLKEDASCEESQNMPSGGLRGVMTIDEGESGKPSHKTANKYKGI